MICFGSYCKVLLLSVGGSNVRTNQQQKDSILKADHDLILQRIIRMDNSYSRIHTSFDLQDSLVLVI